MSLLTKWSKCRGNQKHTYWECECCRREQADVDSVFGVPSFEPPEKSEEGLLEDLIAGSGITPEQFKRFMESKDRDNL